MALLSLEKRKQYFKDLGLEYNEATIKALQRKYMWRKSDADGKYGPNTDNMVRTVRNVLKFTKNFDPKEFRCECGGKYCSGYPSWMKKVELENLQSIRDHYGKPMTITCGLRCKGYNKKLRGSIQNSKHLTGYATDFYMKGVTDTLANRKAAIKYIKKLPNHNYTYGNGINSNGVKVSAGYMGNALHTDTNKPKAVTKAVQNAADAMKNAATAAPVADPLQKWYDAMTTQFNWSKNQVYAWCETPTVANSKKKGTCITFPAVSLQRIGMLPKGKYFYFHPKKKRISGTGASYVKKHPELYKVSYPNKTLKQLRKEGKIHKGDIVGYGNPGYHTMVYMGLKDSKSRFNTMGHKRGLGVTYPSYAKRKVNMVVHIKKLK